MAGRGPGARLFAGLHFEYRCAEVGKGDLHMLRRTGRRDNLLRVEPLLLARPGQLPSSQSPQSSNLWFLAHSTVECDCVTQTVGERLMKCADRTLSSSVQFSVRL